MRWPWRRSPDPLGDGVWWRAHARFRRAVDRYHQVIEPVPPGPVREQLEEIGAGFADALDRVHEVCRRAQALAPSGGLDVPADRTGSTSAVQQHLSQAGTFVAQAAQAAVMARVAGEGAAGDGVRAARRALAVVVELVQSAADCTARSEAAATATSVRAPHQPHEGAP